MTVTVLGPGGYPKPPYGSFAGKSSAAGDSKSYVQPFSVLGPGGYPRPPYASFAGKPTSIVTARPNMWPYAPPSLSLSLP